MPGGEVRWEDGRALEKEESDWQLGIDSHRACLRGYEPAANCQLPGPSGLWVIKERM